MIEELPHNDLLLFTQLLNAVFCLQHVPTNWKVSKVIMLLEPRKPLEDIQFYRPIALLSIQNKVFEKVLHRHLLRLLPAGSLPDHQFGFRARHSTVDQVQRVSTAILSSLEEKRFCSSVFLDIAQAFDRVWHTSLLHKLHLLLPHNICDLLANYLQSHRFVTYGDAPSSYRPIAAGVTQGSVVGPLLFTLFIADLPRPPDSTILATFADDTAFLASSSSYQDSIDTLQSAVTGSSQWAANW